MSFTRRRQDTQLTPSDFRAARKAMGHTQHTLAEALRMGRHGWQTISSWENGKQAIPGPVQIAMEHLANCRIAENRATEKDISHI